MRSRRTVNTALSKRLVSVTAHDYICNGDAAHVVRDHYRPLKIFCGEDDRTCRVRW
jgi:hypothetical protein